MSDVRTEVMLDVERMSVRYGDYLAVNDVSLVVKRNQVHGLIGPNGAGKTSCFHAITGFVTPSTGCIRLGQRDITAVAPWKRARLGLVRSFQISAVFGDLSALHNVRNTIARREGRTGSLWRSARSLEVYEPEANSLLERVGLQRDGSCPARQLPYGKKRSLEIATTLAMKPAVMLLDEPTAGMTDSDVVRMIDLLRDVARGQTVLMVEHNLKVVSSLCSQVTVMRLGEVISSGTYGEVSRDARVQSAYLGRGKR